MDGLDDQSDADNQKIRKVRTNKWSSPVPRGRGVGPQFVENSDWGGKS